MRRAICLGAMAMLAMHPAPARAEPTDRTLFYVGLGLAVPTYLVGVTLHEGSHALMGKLVGAKIDEVHLFPPGTDPRVNKFRFGWVYAHGLYTKTQKQLFLIAPKITDAVLLGGYAALAFTDAWPDGRYGRLALTVFATGLWVDFAKDVILFSPTNDVVKVFRNWCMTGWRQVPARAVYAAAVVGFGYVVWHGYTRTFTTLADDSATRRGHAGDPVVSLPVFSSPF